MPTTADLDAAFGVHRHVYTDGVWNLQDAVYSTGLAIVGLVVFFVVLFRVWRSCIRVWGSGVGLILGVFPALIAGLIVGIFCGLIWPLTVLAPIALYLARKDRSERGAFPGQPLPQFRATHVRREPL